MNKKRQYTCIRFPRASVLYQQTPLVFFFIIYIYTLVISPPHRWAVDQDTFYGKTENRTHCPHNTKHNRLQNTQTNLSISMCHTLRISHLQLSTSYILQVFFFTNCSENIKMKINFCEPFVIVKIEKQNQKQLIFGSSTECKCFHDNIKMS